MLPVFLTWWPAWSAICQNRVKKRARRANIIPGWVDPADMREIKRLLDMMDIDNIMFPDTSGVLDTPLTGKQEYFPAGGTTIQAFTCNREKQNHSRVRANRIVSNRALIGY